MLRANEKVVKKKKILERSSQTSNIQKLRSPTREQKTLLIPGNEITQLIFKSDFLGILELVLVKTQFRIFSQLFETLEFHSWPHPLNLTSPSPRRKNKWRRKHLANTNWALSFVSSLEIHVTILQHVISIRNRQGN